MNCVGCGSKVMGGFGWRHCRACGLSVSENEMRVENSSLLDGWVSFKSYGTGLSYRRAEDAGWTESPFGTMLVMGDL